MKSVEDYFSDWENHVFGFGYGTGEKHTIAALKDFFAAIPKERPYDYQTLEEILTARVAWLLVNILCHADLIEYGTSPRHGWLTKKGKLLHQFIDAHSLEELVGFTNHDASYTPCYPDYCNCERGLRADCTRDNLFWSATG